MTPGREPIASTSIPWEGLRGLYQTLVDQPARLAATQLGTRHEAQQGISRRS